jgi:hypothetical protein
MNEFLEGKTPHFSCCFSQPELRSPLITTAASNTYHPPITSTAAVLHSLSLSISGRTPQNQVRQQQTKAKRRPLSHKSYTKNLFTKIK